MERELVILPNYVPTTIFYVPATEAAKVPVGIVHRMNQIMNQAIEDGRTYSETEKLSFTEFKHRWMSQYCAIMVQGNYQHLSIDQPFMGMFLIKNDFHGRCKHICTGDLLVNPKFRNIGVGKALGRLFLDRAQEMGYNYCIFNLIFETNIASVKLCTSLGFEQIGKIPHAGILKNESAPISALVYGKALYH